MANDQPAVGALKGIAAQRRSYRVYVPVALDRLEDMSWAKE